EYGEPRKKLLSSGTVENLDALIKQLGFVNAEVHRVEPLGAEKLAFWLNAIGPLLLIVGAAGIYIEMKTPGFGLPGIVGISAFALYFMGGYVAGLAGLEWMVVFLLGITLVILELFVFPGTILLGVGGGLLMLVGLVMGTTDIYPGMPNFPTVTQLKAPMNDLMIAFAGSVALVYALSRYLPKTSLYGALISQSVSGVTSVAAIEEQHRLEVGAIGVTLSTLRPGGKAQFGNTIRDVMSQGEMIEKGRPVRIIRHSATEAVVELLDDRT
ncbi:MAG TPA: hypothetical protein VK968_17515, partial [Roseimicrobium sp.]|nr:hypothetical protein [Roseimicrobium sp.]